jgi:hypothetical protein
MSMSYTAQLSTRLPSNPKSKSVLLKLKKLYIDRRPPLVGEVSDDFSVYRLPLGQRDGRYGRIIGFLDRSRYFFFQVAPQLYSRG